MYGRLLICLVAVLCVASADTLMLKDGKSVQGTYLGGDSRQIRMAVGDRVQTFDVATVAEIQFGTAAAASVPAPPARAQATTATAPSTPPAPPVPARAEILRPEPPVVVAPAAAPARAVSELPAGTTLVVRMIDDVDSARDRVGQEFRASIDEPVMLNGEVVIPRGADVVAKLIDDKEAGNVSGRTELTIDLVSVQVNDRIVDINTSEITRKGDSQTRRTAGMAGGGAALGAIIGAIAGGGKGAAIGAVSGAGAGGAVAVVTKGQKVQIPSETRLEFTTQYPVRL
jgi:hypothetical protein